MNSTTNLTNTMRWPFPDCEIGREAAESLKAYAELKTGNPAAIQPPVCPGSKVREEADMYVVFQGTHAIIEAWGNYRVREYSLKTRQTNLALVRAKREAEKAAKKGLRK